MPHLRLFSRNAGRFKASSASFRSLSTAKSFADTVFSRNIIDKSPSQALFCVIFFAWLRLKNTQRALLAVIPANSRLPRDSFPASLRLKHTHKQFLAVIPADSPILPFSFVARLQLNSPALPFLAVPIANSLQTQLQKHTILAIFRSFSHIFTLFSCLPAYFFLPL